MVMKECGRKQVLSRASLWGNFLQWREAEGKARIHACINLAVPFGKRMTFFAIDTRHACPPETALLYFYHVPPHFTQSLL